MSVLPFSVEDATLVGIPSDEAIVTITLLWCFENVGKEQRLRRSGQTLEIYEGRHCRAQRHVLKLSMSVPLETSCRYLY